MNISSQNIIEYIFHNSWKNTLLHNHNILQANLIIEEIDRENIRNTIIKVTIQESNFIFKQPKQIINGASWPIINESRFYTLKQFLPEFLGKSYFDANRNILVVEYFETLALKYILDYIPSISKKLKEFHESLLIKNEIETFAQKYLSATSNPYKDFLRILIKGNENNTFRDEVIFPILMDPNLWIRREILYEFLNQPFIILGVSKINEISTNKNIIHGDFKINNLGLKDGKIYLFDFELVSLGDIAWDIACLLDSLFYSIFNKTYRQETAISIFKTVIENYKEDSVDFLERVILFWGIKKIERLKIQNIRYSFFLRELDCIKLFFEKSIEISSAISEDLNKVKLYL